MQTSPSLIYTRSQVALYRVQPTPQLRRQRSPPWNAFLLFTPTYSVVSFPPYKRPQATKADEELGPSDPDLKRKTYFCIPRRCNLCLVPVQHGDSIVARSSSHSGTPSLH